MLYSLFYNVVVRRLPDPWVEASGGAFFRLFSYFIRKKYFMPFSIQGHQFQNPVGMPAGWIDSPGKLITTFHLGAGIATIKTITVSPKKGNPRPRIVRRRDQLVNSMGLPNRGLKWWVENFEKPHDHPIIISIKGNGFEEWVQLIEGLETKADIFELNISCPNVADGVLDIENSAELIRDICSITDKAVFLKLSPEYRPDQNLKLVNQVRSHITGVTLINTLPVYEEKLGVATKKGGLSGLPIHSLLKKHLYTLRKNYPKFSELPILATGGIMTPESAYEILTKYRAAPLSITGMLIKGPFFYKNVLEYMQQHLDDAEITVREVLE